MKKDNFYVALLCGIVAFTAGIVAVMFVISIHGGNVSALVRMDPLEPMAAVARGFDEDFVLLPEGHYDGVYAYTIAIDPIASGTHHDLIDYPAYRYGRAGYAWVSGFFTFGRASALPLTLVGLNLISLAIAGYAVSRLAVLFDWPALSGMAIALNPGILIGTTLDTSEPFSAALMAMGLLAWFHRRHVVAAALLALLCLVKELFIAVPIGLLIWELTRGDRAWSTRRAEVLLLGSTLLPLGIWWVYLYGVFGEWPFAQPWLVDSPGIGYLDTMFRAAVLSSAGFDQNQIGILSLCLVLVVALAIVFAAVRAFRARTPIDMIFLGFVAIVSALSWWQLLYPKELFRVLAIPLLLIPAVLAGYSGEWKGDATEEEADLS